MATFWTGYNLQDFLFHGLNVVTPQGFAGVFLSIVGLSICFEGIRTLRDAVYRRFLLSKKCSRLIPNEAGGTASNLVKTTNRSVQTGVEDGADRELLTSAPEIGPGGDAPSGSRSSPTKVSNYNAITTDDYDILVEDEVGIRVGHRYRPYRDTTTSVLQNSQQESGNRVSELLNLSISTLLHMIYITVGYTLMLAVMTWNVLILGATGVGIGIGFYIFGPIRHNEEVTIFKAIFHSLDPSQERLLPYNDQSKTESTSTNSGTSSEPRSIPVTVTGAQVHATVESLTSST